MKVIKTEITHDIYNKNVLDMINDMYGVKQVILHNAHVKITINCPRYILNCIRRSLIDETLTVAFDIESELSHDYTEKYCIQDYVMLNIRMLPLNHAYVLKNFTKLSAMTFTLDVINETKDIRNIYASDIMKDPMLTIPFHKIGTVLKDKRVYIPIIKIKKGIGRIDGAYTFAKNVSFIHTDIKQVSREHTHTVTGSHADKSGYEIQSTESNPMEHILSCTFTNVKDDADVMYLLKYSMVGLSDRIRDIINELASCEVTETQIIMKIINETHTIKEILWHVTKEIDETIDVKCKVENGNITYICNANNTFMQKFKARLTRLADDISALL